MRNKRLVCAISFLSLILFAGISFAQYPDPVVVGPNIYKAVFENERVRVCEITFKPGDEIAMHSHPDHFVYVLTQGKLKLSYPDGTSKDFEGTPGQVVWIPAESHSTVNIGGTEFRALVVELKS